MVGRPRHSMDSCTVATSTACCIVVATDDWSALEIGSGRTLCRPLNVCLSASSWFSGLLKPFGDCYTVWAPCLSQTKYKCCCSNLLLEHALGAAPRTVQDGLQLCARVPQNCSDRPAYSSRTSSFAPTGHPQTCAGCLTGPLCSCFD
jgi:hypothetical protein